jgi:hypothetical protein
MHDEYDEYHENVLVAPFSCRLAPASSSWANSSSSSSSSSSSTVVEGDTRSGEECDVKNDGGISALRSYFDVDSIDVLYRGKSVFTTWATNDGFRCGVLPSSSSTTIAIANDDEVRCHAGRALGVDGGGGTDGGGGAIVGEGARRGWEGPVLYGPVWTTMTLAFLLAVTLNMLLYARHSLSFSSFSLSRIKDIVEGNDDGTMAEVEWDYDVNRLLHAVWMLCAYTWALPLILYLAMRLSRGGPGSKRGGGVPAFDDGGGDDGNSPDMY